MVSQGGGGIGVSGIGNIGGYQQPVAIDVDRMTCSHIAMNRKVIHAEDVLVEGDAMDGDILRLWWDQEGIFRPGGRGGNRLAMERDEAVGIAIGQRISHNKLFVSKLRRKATGIEGEGEGFRELQFGAHHPIIIMNGVMEWATEELVTGMGLRIVVARAVYQFVIQHDVSHRRPFVQKVQ